MTTTPNDPRIIPGLEPEPTAEEWAIAKQAGFLAGLTKDLAYQIAAHRVRERREAIEWAIKANRDECAKCTPIIEYVPGIDEVGAGVLHLLHVPMRQCWSQDLILALAARDRAVEETVKGENHE
jgi:hypothetical protein